MRPPFAFALTLAFVTIGCGDDSDPPDAGDGGRSDGAVSDAASDAGDAGRDGATEDAGSDGGADGGMDGGGPDAGGDGGSPRCADDRPAEPPPDPGGDAGAPPPPPPPSRYLGPGVAVCALAGGGEDTPAEAMLRLGDETFVLGRACNGPYTAEDPGHVFHGAHFTLAPADACSPLVTVVVIDSERYADPPVDIDVTEPLCEGSAMHNTTVLVQIGDRLLEPVVGSAGMHHVATFDPFTGASEGTLDVTLHDADDAGPSVDAHLQYRIGVGVEFEEIIPLFDNLCAPPF